MKNFKGSCQPLSDVFSSNFSQTTQLTEMCTGSRGLNVVATYKLE
jgi:hypothetical protein